MTAYGRHQSNSDDGEILWELRSVNHRYLELSLRLPEPLRSIEPLVRSRLTERLGRGKIDASLRYVAAESGTAALTVNHDLARSLIKEAEAVGAGAENPGSIDPLAVLAWPGVVSEKKTEDSELQEQAMACLDSALDDYMAARAREGQKLVEALEARCQSISAIVAKLRTHRPAVVQHLQDKLRNRISELKMEVDQHRLEQELVFHAQKLDVSEELDRLDVHVSEMENIFKRDEPVGRRLDFLMQEFNREANTLGSKSGDGETTALVVELKVLIEQMREQVQNLE